MSKKARASRFIIDPVTEKPVLALTKPGIQYPTYTDACVRHFGCALFETHPSNVHKPIVFWSRSIN